MDVQRTVRGLLLALILFTLAGPAIAGSTIGLYTDETGASCSFSGNTAGLITAYVVVKPDANGLRGVRFSAPIPACLGAVYVSETPAVSAYAIGTSTDGVSVAFSSCALEPVYALQIQYFRSNTTPCCEFTIAADPLVGSIEGADCGYNQVALTPVTSHFNANASCPCNDETAPFPPDNPTPLDGLTTVSVLSDLAWAPSLYDFDIESYDLYFGTNPNPPLVATLTQPSYQPGQLAEFTQYYWRVVVRDDDGHTTTGPMWMFKTRGLNSPPNPAIITSPPPFATNVSRVASLQWSGLDIDGDALEYDVHLGVDPDSQPLYASALKPHSYTITTPLAFLTTYYWYVVSRDPLGHETNSATVSFTTRPENYRPNNPTSPSPADNATAVSASPALSWFASDLDVGEPLTFDIYLGTANPPPLVVTNHPTMSYSAVGLSWATKHYWKIVVRDSHGAEAQGPVWAFTTRPENYAPVAPSSPSPANSGTNISTNPTLSWQASDADGDPLTYDVYFGITSPLPLVAGNVTDKVFPTGILAFSTPYFWRIVARDSHGAETSGAQWKFTTGPNHAPTTPNTPSPATNAVIQPLQVHLTWLSFDNDPGQTVTYDVYFGGTTSPPQVASNLGSPAWDTPVLAASASYFWRVVARDDLGLSTNGPLWKFTTTGGQNPNAPTNPIPQNGASIGSTSVVLQWSMGAQYTSFNISFGTSQTPPFVGTTQTRSYDPGPLQYGQTYYWSVAGSDGSSSIAGPTWQFTVGGGVPVLFSRFGAEATESGARISWAMRSDEAMQSYTLFRRTGAGAFAQVVSAPVVGSNGTYLDRDVEAGQQYRYQLLIRTSQGDEFRSTVATVSIPAFDLTLGPNHPNPFNPQTSIPYYLPASAGAVRVRLVVYDSAGHVVRVLVDESQSAGAHAAVWDGSNQDGSTVTSGLYFCVLQAGKEHRTQKMVLLK